MRNLVSLLAPLPPSRRFHSVRRKGTATRHAMMFAMVVFTLAAPNAMAHYDVTLGTTDTAGVWNGNEWIPSGTGSTVSVNTIQSKLAQGAVTIGTGTDSDGGTEEGDITVSNALSWDANTLTLTAANALNINAVMTAGGTAGLVLNTAPVISPLGSNLFYNTGLINVGMGGDGFIGRVDFTGSGNTMTINGEPAVIVTTLGTESDIGNDVGLQGMRGAGHYVLGADIDASPTASWNGGLGFTPMTLTTADVSGTEWAGAFNGLGHTIDGLTINRPAPVSGVGLFQTIAYGTTRNLGLTNVDIIGRSPTGALAGRVVFAQDVANVYVTGSVTGTTDVGGIGGLTHSHVGFSNIYSSASVTGSGDNVGGLLGSVEDRVWIDKAYTTGNIGGFDMVGGLVGWYWGISGTVGSVTNSYSSATITANYGCGLIGGLDSGLYAERLVDTSYFTGLLASTYPSASLIFDGGRINLGPDLYYNSDTVHDAYMVEDWGTPLTTAEMQQQASYTGFDFANTWVIYEGHTAPLLRAYQGNIDSDGDGYYNNEDAFPFDDTQWLASPNAFSFTHQSDAVMNTVVASNTITVSGISVATPISIDACTSTSCEYRIDAGLWRSDASMVNNGDTVQVRQMASDNYVTQTSLTLTIGDMTETFSVTTEAAPAEGDGGTASSGGGGGAFGLWFLALLLPLLRRRWAA